MKVLVTGATGFVGRWLTSELLAAGHEVTPAPSSTELDIADVRAVRSLVTIARPDVIAHLAAVAASADAIRDPGRAVRTNIGGTIAITEAARTTEPGPSLLIISSAEVYAAPASGDPSLDEGAPLAPRHPYGMLKLAQEAVAITAAMRDDLSMVIVRPFNHVGPGQRSTTAVASFAERIAAIRRGDSRELTTGNLDVERDIGDVRDYVVAYRLILEALAEGRLGRPHAIFNLSTGAAVTLRWIVTELCRLAAVRPTIVTDPDLVRADDPPRIVGDAGRLRRTLGWRPRTELSTTLADILAQHPA
ncbi:MAG: GDP-mannose 4,6-dehydratase [Candidatus Limnocylindria bacterium]